MEDCVYHEYPSSAVGSTSSKESDCGTSGITSPVSRRATSVRFAEPAPVKQKEATRVRCHVQPAGNQKVQWDMLKGDKGFKMGMTLDRKLSGKIKDLVSEISVPRTELAWRERISISEYVILRQHRFENPKMGLHTKFLSRHGGESGIFRCKGCGNFLFDMEDVLPHVKSYLTFRSTLQGGLTWSANPRATQNDLDCAICLSYVGQYSDRGFHCNWSSVVFEPLNMKEVDAVHKICRTRYRAVQEREHHHRSHHHSRDHQSRDRMDHHRHR